MCNNATKNFRQVELLIDATTLSEFPLTNETDLATCKRIIGIEVYKVGNVSVSPTGRPVINNTIFNKSYLVLSTAGNDEIIDEIPFASMDRTANQGQIFRVDIPPIAPGKCKVKIGSLAGLVVGESFLIGFHYEL